MNRLVKSIATGLVALLLGSAAHADLLSLSNFQWAHSPRSGDISPKPAGFGNVGAGMFSFQATGVDEWNGELLAFCIDTTTALRTSGSNPYTIAEASTTSFNAQLPLLGELFDRFFDGLNGNSTEVAAFQLAIWEIIYDYATIPDFGPDLGGGVFEVLTPFSGARDRATAMLNALEGNGGSQFDLFVLTPGEGTSNQTLLTWRPKPVPEPGSLALLAIGLLLVLGLRQRRLATRAA